MSDRIFNPNRENRYNKSQGINLSKGLSDILNKYPIFSKFVASTDALLNTTPDDVKEFLIDGSLMEKLSKLHEATVGIIKAVYEEILDFETPEGDDNPVLYKLMQSNPNFWITLHTELLKLGTLCMFTNNTLAKELHSAVLTKDSNGRK